MFLKPHQPVKDLSNQTFANMGSTVIIPDTMQGMVYLGDKQVKIKTFPVPEPREGEVLLKMKASSICGSDLHAIYRLPSSCVCISASPHVHVPFADGQITANG